MLVNWRLFLGSAPAFCAPGAGAPTDFEGMDDWIARQMNLEPQIARTKATDEAMLHAAAKVYF